MHHKKKVGKDEEEVKNINCLLEVKEERVFGMEVYPWHEEPTLRKTKTNGKRLTQVTHFSA